jgi:hypothetical protein
MFMNVDLQIVDPRWQTLTVWVVMSFTQAEFYHEESRAVKRKGPSLRDEPIVSGGSPYSHWE